MAMTARMGLGDATAATRGGLQQDQLEVKTTEMVLGSPLPPLAEGEKLYRSSRAGLGLVMHSELDNVVGGKHVPGKWLNIRFEPVGDAELPFGELKTGKVIEQAIGIGLKLTHQDVIDFIEGNEEKGIKPHKQWVAGNIVDASRAHYRLKESEREKIAERASNDPEFAAGLVEALRKKGVKVKGFAELLSKPPAPPDSGKQPKATEEQPPA